MFSSSQCLCSSFCHSSPCSVKCPSTKKSVRGFSGSFLTKRQTAPHQGFALAFLACFLSTRLFDHVCASCSSFLTRSHIICCFLSKISTSQLLYNAPLYYLRRFQCFCNVVKFSSTLRASFSTTCFMNSIYVPSTPFFLSFSCKCVTISFFLNPRGNRVMIPRVPQHSLIAKKAVVVPPFFAQ